MELSERRQLILKLTIQDYIESCRPISSESLVRKYELLFSSATIRNELAALEELGLLTHWHTSAGRVPTDAGYRYYVENLMERTPLSAQEQRTIQHQFYQVRGELDQWIHLAAAVLARSTQSAAVVTLPRSYEARFKHVELIGIHDSVVLLIMVLHDGTMRQQSITLEQSLSQEDLSRTASRLNESLLDAPMARVNQLRAEADGAAWNELERQILDIIVRTMHQREGHLNENLHYDGLREMLAHSEFEHIAQVRDLLDILGSQAALAPLIPQVLAADGVQVIIGAEHTLEKMRNYSVILSRYGYGNDVAGIVGLIGPTRMAYPRSISTVGYISSVMSGLLADMYGDRAPLE
ncbi:MAG: heat-inducible transcriptional repressor HrcA [Herpetosiphon sp.]